MTAERKRMRTGHRRLKEKALKALVIIMAAALFAMTAEPLMYRVYAEGTGEIDAGTDIKEISKFGNIKLIINGRRVTENDLEAAGIEYGDMVTVSFLDQQFEMPVVRDFSEVSTGDMMLREDDNEAQLAINMGDFASKYIADIVSSDDESVEWAYKEGISDVTFHIAVTEKGGLFTRYGHDQLKYTDERSDYPDLSDEQFANFRVIGTTGMGKNLLYRSATPVDPQRKRNTYADAACRKYGIATVLNLSDSKDKMKSFPGYDETYYSTTDCIALNMGVDFTSDDFRKKLAEGLRYLSGHSGPYLVHCTEGKDRAGVASALLECLMGATYDEVVADYMVTYFNYYGITPDDERYDTIVSENIEATLKTMFGTDDLANADLAAGAEEYFREIGLTDDEISALRAKLGGEDSGQTKKPDYVSLAVFVTALFIGLAAAGAFRGKRRREQKDG